MKELPSVDALEGELKREKYKKRYNTVLRSTVFTLLVVAAAATLLATFFVPVLQIYGTSMYPTLKEGEIVLAVKTNRYDKGDVIGFYYNNKILIKRIIGISGDWIDLMEDGTVCVNGEILKEPYIDGKFYGSCDIELPYQVPEGKMFVMGDQRETSIDSRNTAVGCVSEDQVVGEILFTIWPFGEIGAVQ